MSRHRAQQQTAKDRHEKLGHIRAGLTELRDIVEARGLAEMVKRIDTALQGCEVAGKTIDLDRLQDEVKALVGNR